MRRGNQTRRNRNKIALRQGASTSTWYVEEMVIGSSYDGGENATLLLLPAGSPVRVLAESGGWSYVRIWFRGQNVYGWTRNSNLTTITRLPQP